MNPSHNHVVPLVAGPLCGEYISVNGISLPNELPMHYENKFYLYKLIVNQKENKTEVFYQYANQTENADKTNVKIKCKICNNSYDIIVNKKDLQDWKKGKGYIQDILSDLSDSERELLISGTCGTCFDKMFNSDENI